MWCKKLGIKKTVFEKTYLPNRKKVPKMINIYFLASPKEFLPRVTSRWSA